MTEYHNCHTTPIVLVMALGLHSIFEGIALGLADELSETEVLVAAVMIHKWAAALSLGVCF